MAKVSLATNVILIDQIPVDKFDSVIDSLEALYKAGIRVRIKRDGRTSTPVEDLFEPDEPTVA